ncbi:hypothetical protein FXO38_17937 [Capsicum annuum]|nr:hypothetical protein FXO38_17937 [Capsicum annuum]KAF3669291.1 hypothetical protein FXO37_09103 [Capsicum annuum]
MMRAPRRYIEVLVYEFYVAYKGDDVLRPVWADMLAGFTAGCAFDVGELLARELRVRKIGSQKAFLAYPCMITQICLALGVMELLGIDEMIDTWRTFDISLIQDMENPLA